MRNILLFGVRIGCVLLVQILGILGRLVCARPALMVPTCHDYLLHILHVVLLVHESLKPLRYFILRLELYLLPVVDLSVPRLHRGGVKCGGSGLVRLITNVGCG
jgi:hypothetical protein